MAVTAQDRLARAIRQGQGIEPADLVIAGVGLLDIVTGAVETTDIAICEDRIAGTYGRYDGRQVIDAKGLFAVPGFIDAHVHIESTLLTPLEFDRCVLPHGVTTAVCDPHEIANVLGVAGIRYVLECAECAVMDLRVQLSPCVPATAFETAGARLEAADLASLLGHPKVLGLGELMNFPGVLSCDPRVLDKLALFQERVIDGHCPLLRGRALNGYLASGVCTDHESTSADEAREKLQKGLAVFVREGSVSKDLDALLPLMGADTSSFMAFCTDDRNPLDIADEGHVDAMIRRAIAGGVPRHHAYRMASWSAAMAFRLRDRGFLAPGRRADVVLVDDLDRCRVHSVVSAGRLVTDALFAARRPVLPIGLHSVHRRPVHPMDLVTAAQGPTRVIGVLPGRIITEDLALELPHPGVNHVAVVSRHGANDNIGRAHVRGFALQRGAIASSVGHDSHNITVVGADGAAMARAVNRVIALQGGFVVADADGILAELPLPLAGLMTIDPYELVRQRLLPLRESARELGCPLREPFLQLSFLSLPVIPHLKLTDRGLVDVDRFILIPS